MWPYGQIVSPPGLILNPNPKSWHTYCGAPNLASSGADESLVSVRRASRLDRPMTPSKMCVTHLTRDLKAFRANPPPLAPLVHVSEKEI